VEGLESHRSSFIGAALATLPNVRVSATRPRRLSLADDDPVAAELALRMEKWQSPPRRGRATRRHEEAHPRSRHPYGPPLCGRPVPDRNPLPLPENQSTARSRWIRHPRKSLITSDLRTATGWTGPRNGYRLFQGEVGPRRSPHPQEPAPRRRRELPQSQHRSSPSDIGRAGQSAESRDCAPGSPTPPTGARLLVPDPRRRWAWDL
jgi:hypothetical protein